MTTTALRSAVAVASLLALAACSSPPYPPPGRAAPPRAAAPAAMPGTAVPDMPAPAMSDTGTMTAPAGSGITVTTRAASTPPPPQAYSPPLRTERWWPDWADPANWFLEEKYRL